MAPKVYRLNEEAIACIGMVAIATFGIILICNLEVTSRRGINFHVETIKIPAYLKILDFIDRHYNYKQLVKTILKDTRLPQDKISKLFAWTHNNIKKTPEGWPIIDDHVWHIIVRGYGESDQSSDVFVTLCNYAGINAFFRVVHTKDRKEVAVLSFVELDKKMRVFDTYNGVYFLNKNGDFATLQDIKNKKYLIKHIAGREPESIYEKYFEGISGNISTGFNRGVLQSPIKRIIAEFKKWLAAESIFNSRFIK